MRIEIKEINEMLIVIKSALREQRMCDKGEFYDSTIIVDSLKTIRSFLLNKKERCRVDKK